MRRSKGTLDGAVLGTASGEAECQDGVDDLDAIAPIFKIRSCSIYMIMAIVINKL